MSHTRRTKAQLIQEIEALQAQVATLESLQAAFQQIRGAFREFMEQSYDGFVLFDETGTIIEWNESQARITGISQEEALGLKTWDTLFRLGAVKDKTPKNYEIIKNRALALLETGKAPWMKQSMERVIQRPDGERRVVRSITFPIPTEQGFQIGSITCDITSSKHTEQALLESETRLQAIANTTPSVLYIYDAIEDKNVWVNATHREVIGSISEEDSGDLTSKSAADRMHPDDFTALFERLEKLQEKEDGEWLDVEYRLKTADGQWHWFHDRASVFERDESGKVVKIIGSAIDITEHKQAEEALHKSEARLAEAQTIAQIGSFELHATDGPVYWSKALYDILGADPDQPPSDYETFASRIHPDDRADVDRAFERAFKDGTNPGVHFRCLIPGGLFKNIYARGRVIFDDQGRPEMLVGTAQDVTEFKQAERALRENQQYLSRLMGNLPGVAYRMKNDEFWSAEFLSGGIQDLAGYPPDDFLGNKKRDFGDLIHPDDREAVWERVQQALKDRQPFELTYRILTADGQEKWVWERGQGVSGDDGEVPVLEGFITDISDLKQTEQALRESEERYRTLVEFAPIAISILGRDDRYVYVNPTWERMTGYSREDAENMIPIEMVHPDMRESVQERLEARLRGEKVTPRYELKILTKDGETKWADFSARLITIEGKPAVLMIANDITDYRQAAEALRQERDKAQTYLDIVNVIVVAIDSSQQVTLINQQGCKSLGYSEEEVIGKNWFDTFVPETDREQVKAVFARLMAGEVEPVEYYENTIINKDGEERLIAWHNTVLRDEGGSIVGTLSSGEDITESRQAEEALKRSEREKAAILDSLSEIVDFQDKDHRIIWANRASGESVGLHPDQLVGRFCHQIWNQSSKVCENCPIERVWETDKTEEGEITTTDGRIWLLRGNPVHDEQGNLVGVVEIGEDITERKRAEQALRESEARYRILVEHAPISVILIQDGRYIFINPTGARILGFSSPQEAVGVVGMDYVAPPFREMITERMQNTDAGRANPTIVFESQRVDGTTLPFESTSVPVTYQDRPATLVIGQDITERKRAEQALRESEARYRALFEQANDAILIENEDDDILDVNRRACELLGYTREELLSMKVSQLQAPECRKPEGQAIKSELEQHGGQPFETVDVRRDGTRVPVEVTTSHLTGLEDSLALSIVRDITERKQTEKELRQSLDLLNSTQRLSKVGGWEWDVDSQTMFWTEETYRIHGSKMPDLSIEAHIEYSLNCYDPDDRAIVSAAFQRCAEEGQKYDLEFPFTDVTGKRKWIRTTAEPVIQDGKIVRVIGNMADITERKRVEQAEHEQRILAEALANTTSVLSSTLDLNEVFDRILDNVGRVVPHDTAHILLVEDDVCRIIRTRGYEEKQIRQVFRNLRFNVNDTPNMRQMFETRKPVIIDDVRHYPGWIPTPGLEQLHGYIGTPICVGGETLGFLDLFSQEPDSFTEQDTGRLQAFADQAAIAIKNAQLFEAERRERALAQTFQNVSAGLNSPVAMIDTLDLIAGSLAQALDYEQVALLMTDGDQLSIVAARGTDPAQKHSFAYPDITALYLSMASGDPLIISVDQETGSSEAELPVFEPGLTRGWIGMPLVVAEVVIGYLCVSTRKSIALKARDLEVVRAFAQQAEFVIGNSLILDELAISLTSLHEARERLSRAARLSVAGEIAAGVAHQINNPLTTVVAQVYLLMKKLPTEHPGFKHVEAIKQAAYRAGSVVQRMLDFGRPTPFLRNSLDINQSIESAISLVRAQIEPHIAQIKVELAPDLPPIKGSVQHLEDVWLNLLLNARDALTSKEHGIINVTTGFDTQHNAVTIVIKDNGPGISPEDLARVFDPFFTKKSHGTGLGLAICQDVIVKHNGTITVNSIEGQQTTFTISLPV